MALAKLESSPEKTSGTGGPSPPREPTRGASGQGQASTRSRLGSRQEPPGVELLRAALQAGHAPAITAQAHLALGLVGGEATKLEASAEFLCQPGHYRELAEAAPWLLPGLLRSPQDTGQIDLLGRLLLEFPHLAYVTAKSELPVDARRRLLDGLVPDEPWRKLAVEHLLKDPEPTIRQRAEQRLDQAGHEHHRFAKLHITSFGALKVMVGGKLIEKWRSKRPAGFSPASPVDRERTSLRMC